MVNGHEHDPDRPEEGCKSERAADPDPAKHQARVAPLCAALEAHGLDSNSSFYLHHLTAHEGDCRAALEAIHPGFAVSCQATEHANKLFKLQAVTLFFMLNGWRGDTSRTMFRFIMCDRARRMIYFIETVPKERAHGALVAGEKWWGLLTGRDDTGDARARHSIPRSRHQRQLLATPNKQATSIGVSA